MILVQPVDISDATLLASNVADSSMIGVWTAGGSLATARSEAGGAGTQDAGVCFGGNTTALPAATPSALTDKYNGTTWASSGALLTARYALGGAGTQTAGLSFGGNTAATAGPGTVITASAVTEEYNGATWVASGPLLTARCDLAGCGGQSAAVAVGGRTGVGANSNATEEYNGATWGASGSLSTARYALGGAGTQTAGLFFCGNTGAAVANAKTEEYNGATWASGPDGGIAKEYPSGAGALGAALSIGGAPVGQGGSVEEYNGAVWAFRNGLLTARSKCSSGGQTSAALAFAGFTGTANLASTEEYTTRGVTSSDFPIWTAGGPMVTARKELSGAGASNAALSFGGFVAAVSAVTERYDGATWASSGALNTARNGLGGLGTQASALAFGGHTGAAFSAATEKYLGASWAADSPLLTARQFLAGAGTTTAGLSIGGGNGTDLSKTEEYNGATWAAEANLNAARQGAGGAGGQTAGLCFGGSVATSVSDTETYDGLVWSTTARLLAYRLKGSSAGTSASALAAGGEKTTAAVIGTSEGFESGVWSLTGHLLTARRATAGCGSALGALIFGGEVTGNIADTEKFAGGTYPPDPKVWRLDAWATSGNLSSARGYHGGMGTQGGSLAALAFTGYNGASNLASTERYRGRIWHSGPSTGFTARRGLACAGSNTGGGVLGSIQGVAFGGFVAAVSAVTEEFDQEVWISGGVGSLLTARRYLAGAGAGLLAVSFGGETAGGTTATGATEKYAAAVWTASGSLLTARFELGGVGVQNAALAFGGSTNGTTGVSTTEEYNGATWAVGGSLLAPRFGVSGVGTQTAALSFGGSSLGATELYDGTVWAASVGMLTARSNAAGAGTTEEAICFGGTTPAYLSSTEEYISYAEGTRVAVTPKTAPVTISTSGVARVTWTAHGLTGGTPVLFTSTGVLPTGLRANQKYYVSTVINANIFTLAVSPGGREVTVTGVSSGAHTGTAVIHDIYESLANGNAGKWPLSETTWWARVGPVNKWAMFDTQVYSETSNPSRIYTLFQTSGRVDSVVLIGVNATTARFVMTSPVSGVVFDQTVSLVSSSGITDWHGYFFDPIVLNEDYARLDLPQYPDAQIEVTLTSSGGMVTCGAMILGGRKELGFTQAGMSLGIQDYSVKKQDDFGNYTILERAFSKRGAFTIFVKNDFVDELQRTLAAYRATPVVYVGSEAFGSSIIYGFYKDFSTVVTYPEYAVCNLEVEGLT